MTEDLEPDVRAAVTDLLIRYATGIDTKDWELFRTCFTDDCDLDYGEIGHWHGVDEVTTWMANTHDPLGPTLHRISNIALEVVPSGIAARSYVHAVLPMPDGSGAVHAFGYYEDELVADGDGWRIARRQFTMVTTELRARTEN